MNQTLVTASICSSATPSKDVIGIDLGDRWSRFCVLDQAGSVKEESRVQTTSGGFAATFGTRPRSRMVIEVGAHSPWVSRLLQAQGHEVIVANPRKVRAIYTSDRKSTDRGSSCRTFGDRHVDSSAHPERRTSTCTGTPRQPHQSADGSEAQGGGDGEQDKKQ
ncbi:MAG TPA: transposase [Candidatus Acidoferrales bacterium]|nr:transposase [Candidatus Acidoferrales bacterium]